MSKKNKTKKEEPLLCDFCDKEITKEMAQSDKCGIIGTLVWCGRC